jgi:hypothetical protein
MAMVALGRIGSSWVDEKDAGPDQLYEYGAVPPLGVEDRFSGFPAQMVGAVADIVNIGGNSILKQVGVEGHEGPLATTQIRCIPFDKSGRFTVRVVVFWPETMAGLALFPSIDHT